MCYRRAHRPQRWGGETDLFTVSTRDSTRMKRDTLDLYAPSDALAVLPVEVFALQYGAIFVGEVLDVCENSAFEGIRANGVWFVGINGDGNKPI